MKKIICILIVLLLSTWAWAEETAQPVCEHEYWREGIRDEHAWIVEEAAEGAFECAAICPWCRSSCLIVKDKTLLTAEPCKPEECTHRLCILPQFTKMVWEPANNGEEEINHVQLEYCVGVCMDCGTVAAVYNLTAKEPHQMVDKQGFHIDGQYTHVTCRECAICGMMTGELVPCISNETGICERMPATR